MIPNVFGHLSSYRTLNSQYFILSPLGQHRSTSHTIFYTLQVLECMYVRQALDLLEGLIPAEEENKDLSPDHLRVLIVFAFMWSLGALLELDDRKKVRCSILYIVSLLRSYS